MLPPDLLRVSFTAPVALFISTQRDGASFLAQAGRVDQHAQLFVLLRLGARASYGIALSFVVPFAWDDFTNR